MSMTEINMETESLETESQLAEVQITESLKLGFQPSFTVLRDSDMFNLVWIEPCQPTPWKSTRRGSQVYGFQSAVIDLKSRIRPAQVLPRQKARVFVLGKPSQSILLCWGGDKKSQPLDGNIYLKY